MQLDPVKIVVLVAGGYVLFLAVKVAMQDKNVQIDTTARTIWGEARGEGSQGMQGVANVIQNRVKQGGWWGATFAEVCKKKSQFSCWNEGDPNHAKLLAVTMADRDFVTARAIATKAVSWTLPDITGGANHYHNKRTKPNWADDSKITVTIGNHIFYKL